MFRVDVDDGEHFYIDASDVRRSNFTRYLNDPGYLCEPNCEFVQTDLKIEVCTLRDIAANEELTARYIEWNTFLGSDSEDTEDMVAPRSTRPRRTANQSASRASTSSVVPLPAPSPRTAPAPSIAPYPSTAPSPQSLQMEPSRSYSDKIVSCYLLCRSAIGNGRPSSARDLPTLRRLSPALARAQPGSHPLLRVLPR